MGRVSLVTGMLFTLGLLSRERSAGGRDARGIARKLIISAALDGGGIARESVRVIEELAIVHADGRTRHRIDRRRVTKQFCIGHVDCAAIAGLQRSSSNTPAEEGIGDESKTIRSQHNAAGVAYSDHIMRLDDGSARCGRSRNGSADITELTVMNKERPVGSEAHANASVELILKMAVVNKHPVGL